MKRFQDSFGCASALNLIIPGLGHMYWREYLFGAFIFLIAAIAGVIAGVAFIVPLNLVARLILFGLPTVFYAFTFVDLKRTITRRNSSSGRNGRTVVLFLTAGVVLQLVLPIAPVNFIIRNAPQVFVVADHRLEPLYGKGDLAAAIPTDYRVNLFFLDRPLWHTTPEYGDLVRFVDSSSVVRNGVVLGMFGEAVQIIDGVLVIDGAAQPDLIPESLKLRGDMALTSVDGSSILVATLNLGAVDATYQIGARGILGRMHHLF
jgi:hypothetical protein